MERSELIEKKKLYSKHQPTINTEHNTQYYSKTPVIKPSRIKQISGYNDMFLWSACGINNANGFGYNEVKSGPKGFVITGVHCTILL